MSLLTKKESILKEAHLRWLSKAKTAKIDGVELTVLPYGYLQQAIDSSLDSYAQAIREEVEKKEKPMLDKSDPDAYEAIYAITGFNDALRQVSSMIKESVKK